jgi:hypothetical protein
MRMEGTGRALGGHCDSDGASNSETKKGAPDLNQDSGRHKNFIKI